MSAISVFAPAKLNLFLAVTGRRADGFHDLVSVVAPLEFGDVLRVEPAAEYSLECDDPGVPCDDTNLVMKAARAFAEATKWKGAAKFMLDKRVPMGAGLGGGSSDAVAALRALNQLAGGGFSLRAPALAALAEHLGSDCPLFLNGGPVVMRGRGERVDPLPASAVQRLRGRRVLIFKPGFSIATPWAYAQLASFAKAAEDGVAGAAGGYLAPPQAEARLSSWLDDTTAPAEQVLFNNMESPAFAKFIALPVLLAQLRREFGVEPHLSGSGSACFGLLRNDTDVARMSAAIREAWGESSLVVETRLA